MSCSSAVALAQDEYPVEISRVDLTTADESATVVLRTESAVEWSVEPSGRELVLLVPRTVPGPDALDRSSRAGMVSLVEVGFAVPDGVPTTRVTVHGRRAFEHQVERTRQGLVLRVRAAGASTPEATQAAKAIASNQSPARPLEAQREADELGKTRRENRQLRQRVAELHNDRLRLRESLDSAEAELAKHPPPSPEASGGAVIEAANRRLLGEKRALEAQLAQSRGEFDQLKARLSQLENEIAAARASDASGDLSERLKAAEDRERELSEQLRTTRATAGALRSWLTRAPAILGATDFVVAPGGDCLPLRSEPDSASAVLDCLAVGSRLAALNFRPDWLRVRTQAGKEGWVAASRVVRPGPDTAAETSEQAEQLGRQLAERLDRERVARESAEADLAAARDRMRELELGMSQLREVEETSDTRAVALERVRRERDEAQSAAESDQQKLRALLAEVSVAQLSVSPDADPCLTLRAGPGTQHQRRDCLVPGTGLTVLDATEDWLSVRVGSEGPTGWLASAFVQSGGQAESSQKSVALERRISDLAVRLQQARAQAESNSLEAAERSALQDRLDASERRAQDLSGTLDRLSSDSQESNRRAAALEAQIERERSEALETLEVTRLWVKDGVDPCLSLRERPDSGSRSLECLGPGTAAEPRAIAGRWFRLRLDDGREGWSSSDYLESSTRRELRAASARLAERDAELVVAAEAHDSELEKARDSAAAALAEADAERFLLAAQLAEERRGASALQSQIAELERRVSELADAAARQAGLANELADAKAGAIQVRERVAELEALRVTERKAVEINKRLLDGQLEAAGKEISRLAALAATAGSVPSLEARIRDSETARAAAETRGEELADRVAALEEDLALANRSLEENRSGTEDLEARASEGGTARAALDGERERSVALQESLATARRELEQAQASLSDSLAGHRGLEDRIAELESELARLGSADRDLASARAENQRLAARVAALEARRPAPASRAAPSEPLAPLPPADTGTVAGPQNPVPADLEAVARAWARAWSDQRVDDYLSFYASSFVPPGGMSRAEWSQLRRERLTQPEFIEVSVGNLSTRIDGPSRAMVSFDQEYRSNAFQDRVVKRLELVLEGDLWKILEEIAE